MRRRTLLRGAATLAAGFPLKSFAATDELGPPTEAELASYVWLGADTQVRRLGNAIATPRGFSRVAVSDGSFGAWLRGLPLRRRGSPVLSFDGRTIRESGDKRVAAVTELDIGTSDLQQCADSAIRLHAEWLWSRGETASIGYHFLSGDFATWRRYAAGERPTVSGSKVVWKATGKPSESRATFRSYLDMVFMFANTMSLAKESPAIEKGDLGAGDFFVQPGSPGHCVIVLDVAASSTGDRVALLGQGFMPAQDFHVLASEESSAPWFSLEGENVDTPFWDPFAWKALHRFAKNASG